MTKVRRGAINGFLPPLLLGGLLGVLAVVQGVVQDAPVLLVVPSVVIGGMLLLVLRKVTEVEKAVAAALPTLQRHDRDITELQDEAATVNERIGQTRHLLRNEFQQRHASLEQDFHEHLDQFHPRRAK